MTPTFDIFLKFDVDLLLKDERDYIYLFNFLFTFVISVSTRRNSANINTTTCSQANKCLNSN